MFRKKVKDKRWKCLRKLDSMSDEELLLQERRLLIKSGIMSVGGLVIFILCIVLLVLAL